MRALPQIQSQCPNARVIIVGGDDVSYGKRPADGKTYRQIYTAELGDQVDWQKVFFVGKLPYATYLKVLQVSAAHVYLTYPFVLSWSMLESMAAGSLVLASDTPPVREIVQDRQNGLLVDFFDSEQLALRVAEALSNPMAYQAIRIQARESVIERYDLLNVCLPQWLKYLKAAPV